MKSSKKHPFRVLATGIVVLILLSITLFWLRFLCSASLSEIMPDDIKSAVIAPSGFLPDDFEKDPNFQRTSQASAQIRPEPLAHLGITEYLTSILPGGHRSRELLLNSDEEWGYFDDKSGQLVLRYVEAEIMPDNDKLYRKVQFYIGSEGISEIPDESLGRFFEPIVDCSMLERRSLKSGEIILYDKKLRRFFRIGLNPRTFVKGPELDPNDTHEPVQIGQLEKNRLMLQLAWSPPEFKSSALYSNTAVRSYGRRSVTPVQSSESGQYHLILDKTGRIDLLDKETLTFAAVAGRLPDTEALFGSERPAIPKNTLSYGAKSIYLGPPRSIEDIRDKEPPELEEKNLRYAGLIAASLSRDGTALALTVFDEKGQIKEQPYRRYSRQPDKSKTAYFGSPWAPASSIVKYVAESLHPPVLSVASFLTATSFEAGAGHRGLFLLPNSFVAMKARDGREPMYERALFALTLMIPAILLALLLVSRILRDATRLGLPKSARRFWIIATIAFGPAGYITYWLTRPRVMPVTCANCGKLRRPDMDLCHRCGSEWVVPELTPPEWRVLDIDKERFEERNEPCTDHSH